MLSPLYEARSQSLIYWGTSADMRQELSSDGTRCSSELSQGALWGTAGTWICMVLCEPRMPAEKYIKKVQIAPKGWKKTLQKALSITWSADEPSG